MDRIWQSQVIIIIVVHELMKEGVDESPDVTGNFEMPVVPEVYVFVAI